MRRLALAVDFVVSPPGGLLSDPLEPYRNVPRPATPGPWRMNAYGPLCVTADARKPARILVMDEYYDQGPDARAIAALPEVLEKLDRLVRAVEWARKQAEQEPDFYVRRNAHQALDAILRGEA